LFHVEHSLINCLHPLLVRGFDELYRLAPRCQQGAILTGDYKFRPGTYSDSKPAGCKGEEETKSGLAGGRGIWEE